MIHRLLAPLACLLLSALAAEAQLPRAVIHEIYFPDPRKKDKTELKVTPLFDQLPPTGYVPVRVYVVNDAKTSRTWNLDFLSGDTSYADQGNELRSSFSVSCDALKSVEVDLLVPVVTAFQYGYSSTSLGVEVAAPPPLPRSRNSLTTDYDEAWPATLISEKLNNLNRGTLTTEVGAQISGSHRHHHGYGPTSSVEFGAAFNPGQMPEDWRAYSGYDACVLTEDDWGALSAGARNAILKWNRLGGSLLIYSPNASTSLASLNIEDGASGSGRSAIRGWGKVGVRELQRGGLLDADALVTLIADDIPRETGANRLRSLRRDFRSSWPLKDKFVTAAGNILFFILILIAFGVLVGPVNLFVFARAGQRHKLFITTPIISLAASGLLVVLILFQDGFGGRGLRAVLMELGPDNSAYLSQEQIARTGVLLKTSFSTEEDGFLSPVLIAESRFARVTDKNRGGKGRYNVEVRDNGLRVTGDWFKSRSEHGHLFETIRPTRAGLSLVNSGGGAPVVSSTFEFPLETLYYLAPDGDVWMVDDLRQGRNTALRPADRPAFDTWLADQQRKFTTRNRLRLDLTARRPGSYVALATSAPGIDTLGAIDWKETTTLITGTMTVP